MIFIETSIFSKTIQALLTDDEYRGLQGALLENPARGDLIPGGAGLRKLRWARQGTGMSGGLRRAADDLLLGGCPGSVFDGFCLPEKQDGKPDGSTVGAVGQSGKRGVW